MTGPNKKVDLTYTSCLLQALVICDMLNLLAGWQTLLSIVLIFVFVKWAFTPPAELRHLPRAPIIPLLWSYASGEVEDVRIKRLLLPFANEKGEGVVLVYALGRWIVHVLDHQVSVDIGFISRFSLFTA